MLPGAIAERGQLAVELAGRLACDAGVNAALGVPTTQAMAGDAPLDSGFDRIDLLEGGNGLACAMIATLISSCAAEQRARIAGNAEFASATKTGSVRWGLGCSNYLRRASSDGVQVCSLAHKGRRVASVR